MYPSTLVPSLAHASLDSTSLRSVFYSPVAGTMEISFRNGSVYRYFGVPLHVYQSLLAAESKGRYFTAAIRTTFRFERLQ